MNHQGQHRTPTAAPKKRPVWEVWVDMVAPRRAKVRVQRLRWDPAPEDDRAAAQLFRHSARWEFATVPAPLDLGQDRNGLPIIAFEGRLNVVIRDPDGRERVIERDRTADPTLVGWRTLRAFEDRARAGEGVVERWRGPDGLAVWAWNEGGVGDRHKLVVDRDEDD